jgi:hypothetical protein
MHEGTRPRIDWRTTSLAEGNLVHLGQPAEV